MLPSKAEQEKKAQDGMKKLKTTQEELNPQMKMRSKNPSAGQSKLSVTFRRELIEQARFMEAEVQLLKQAKTSSLAELAREAKRIHDEVKNHDASQDVMSKSQQVLVSQCKLSEDDTSSNCAEANAALRRANIGLKALDEYLTNYLAEFTKVSEAQKADIEVTLTTQEASLFQAQADLNRRKDELAQLKSDVVTAKENAILAGKAESALSTNCGPKVSSMEATIASRQEQIEQLKNAVKVLDGQAFV
ncbi:Carbon catabolite-derepressing protein kinase [Durusdinium trenchii]|uniref:Carbon catabolite-derepressing protein kinase n=1 Tax=Durusdinium trenchii TaxID=1381693 RepID=A0ABP0KKM4_9DINO